MYKCSIFKNIDPNKDYLTFCIEFKGKNIPSDSLCKYCSNREKIDESSETE